MLLGLIGIKMVYFKLKKISQTFTVPETAEIGFVRLRALSVWGTTPSVDAYTTTNYTWGEIEEYTVRISEPITLPIELLYFKGYSYSTFNRLIWSTASEQNSDYFDIEHSENGEDWNIVGNTMGAGNTTSKTNYVHEVFFNRFIINYYQLKQVDMDGEFKYYGPISIDNRIKTKKIVKYFNLIGQEVSEDTTGIIFELYEDGTFKKIIR
jgi:hypothetical protein